MKNDSKGEKDPFEPLVSGFTQHLASFSLNRITSRCSIISRGLSPPPRSSPLLRPRRSGPLEPSVHLFTAASHQPLTSCLHLFFLSDVVKKTSSFRDVLSVICSFWGNSSVGAARTSAICFQRVGFFFDCTDLSHFHSNVGIFFKFCLFFIFANKKTTYILFFLFFVGRQNVASGQDCFPTQGILMLLLQHGTRVL